MKSRVDYELVSSFVYERDLVRWNAGRWESFDMVWQIFKLLRKEGGEIRRAYNCTLPAGISSTGERGTITTYESLTLCYLRSWWGVISPVIVICGLVW